MRKTVVENIPAKKIKIVKELIDLINNHKTILIADVSNIPGSQFQTIKKKLRGKAIVKIPKRNLLFRAIEESHKKHIIKIEETIKGAVAVLFSNLDSYELAALLLKNKSPTKAKPGQIAPIDLAVEAGPTELTPGPAISELGAVGIQIQIQGGKIEIKESKVLTKKGNEITQKVADILSKLGIQPFTIGFSPVAAYDVEKDVLYTEIRIDAEEALSNLLEAYGKALPFAVKVGYLTKETTQIMLRQAAGQERRIIRTITGETEVEEIQEEIPQEEAPVEEKKEEANTDFAASFF